MVNVSGRGDDKKTEELRVTNGSPAVERECGRKPESTPAAVRVDRSTPAVAALWKTEEAVMPMTWTQRIIHAFRTMFGTTASVLQVREAKSGISSPNLDLNR